MNRTIENILSKLLNPIYRLFSGSCWRHSNLDNPYELSLGYNNFVCSYCNTLIRFELTMQEEEEETI